MENSGDPGPIVARASVANRNAKQPKARLRLALVSAARKVADQKTGRPDRKRTLRAYFFKRPFLVENAASVSLNSAGFSIIKKWPAPSIER